MRGYMVLQFGLGVVAEEMPDSSQASGLTVRLQFGLGVVAEEIRTTGR